MNDADDILANSTLLYSASEVEASLRSLAQQVTADLALRNPVVIAVMNGGAFTAVNLCRYFRFAYEFDYVHATRYGNELRGGEIQWLVPPRTSLAGRTILLVDDILDRGTTLSALLEKLEETRVAEVHTAVLVRKRLDEEVERPNVEYWALETDDVYVFGCGMDYAGYWRGLPELYASNGA